MIGRSIGVMALAVIASGCATVPPPPSCADTGTKLHPVNPEMMDAMNQGNAKGLPKKAVPAVTQEADSE